MNFEEFKTKIVIEMEQRAGEGEVIIQNTVKNNGVKLTGLIIISPNTNVSPTIYLEEYYADMPQKSFSQIADEIWQIYTGNRLMKEVNLTGFTEWNTAQERIVPKLISYEMNQELLKMVPYDSFLNLAVVFYYIVDVSGEGTATILINNYHLQMWGIRVDVIKERAYRNYHKFYLPIIKNMTDMIKEILGEVPDEMRFSMDSLEIPMYVVTNQLKFNGATIMLFPEELEKLADKWQCNLYIMPSSIHEIIVLPEFGGDSESLKSMVCEVNQTCVEREELLSNSVYFYSRESGTVQIAME